MGKAVFYHAGCPVCVSAEQDILQLILAEQVEVVHLGTEKGKVKDADAAGVKSVPALVLANGNVLHINFGASIDDLK
ncbi:thioredoxin domain-containing protein [Chitinophaga pinensis]|uniref:Thioredoxin n=1 Tax=Chitinophaga pinensis (strain ATCC 43595 / DSM 2588 / LMG 13176 / NBRC 15968 / NCIMB 11800 / UQM 2034) TaxID=485918 RepID=A0A979G9L6_CHIPD|nr:thioredoxin [Chitinophaga pinensis]ACU63464.1 thioredoxin [Chitinophaga pinensis DSM 2588]